MQAVRLVDLLLGLECSIVVAAAIQMLDSETDKGHFGGPASGKKE